MTDTPTGDVAGQADSNARLSDSVTAEVKGPDLVDGSNLVVKGPDPAEWGQEQTIPDPNDPDSLDPNVEVRGPDPEKWGTPEARAQAEAERIAAAADPNA